MEDIMQRMISSLHFSYMKKYEDVNAWVRRTRLINETKLSSFIKKYLAWEVRRERFFFQNS